MENDFSTGTWNYTVLSNSTAAITGYTGEDTKVIIPDGFGTVTFTEIAYKAFFENEGIVSVTIPDTIKKIGESAFCGCCCLSEVIIPDTVEEICEEAFHDCPCLADDNGFVIVRDVLYEYFGESEKVTVPDGVKTIGCYCFSKDNIETITLPDTVCKIEESAFYVCESLHTVFIHSHECKIEDGAFEGCSAQICICK
ncbi:MAG: leucine-rich repeat domain-containing protein [Oscillospiraceae bacterium]|nr:leucine-rich repeat domain-containing protein [Oscillospiraceae bacterium]